MVYTKPEIAVLGDAALVIQGGGSGAFEPGNKSQAGGAPDGELDD